MKYTLLATIFLANSVFATCEKNVQHITKDSPSPCTAWIVDENQMQTFAKQTDQLELSRKLNETNTELLKLSEREMEYYKKKAQDKSAELDKADSRRFWTNLGHFALGVVLTGVAAKAAIESTK